MFYSIPFKGTSGASAGTYKTMAAFNVPNTAGLRLRVRSISVGPADTAPNDRNWSAAIRRVASVSSGSAGTPGTSISAANVPKKDTSGPDCIAGGGTIYSAEPTTFETNPLWQDDCNDRGGIIKEWDQNGAPKALANQLIALCIAPRTANAAEISGTIEVEVY